ncbi:16 kDa beta-galactoside-binding lectin-like [Hemicordylus capensis]|uniref:16 kDa beta-galactoside-binding lectin-like n=1 Tax=Hemicordylus capensis TaxID=884348 RepID=UPI002302348C|nr:16 kDa beta-galactoside-binding lectin-like [Hemicordylus capensis]
MELEPGLTATGLNIQPGQGFQLRGWILPDAKHFIVDLGKDSDNLVLRFNLRLAGLVDTHAIVCNSKQDGMWGQEEERARFPIEKGEKIKVLFTFGTSELKVKVEEPLPFKGIEVEEAFDLMKLEEAYLRELNPPGARIIFDQNRWELEFVFPNRLGLKSIQYLSYQGDFKFQGLKFL